MSSIFRKTCLKPVYSLRGQLLLSFGVPTFLTIALVVTLAVSFAHIAGNEVKIRAGVVLEEQVISSFVSSSRDIAQRVTAYFDSADGALQLMVEVTRDRIVGYPQPGWEDDRYVPFYDTESKRNKYPLRSPLLPLDWNITPNIDQPIEYAPNVNPQNVYEYFQDRGESVSGVTTTTGIYHFQGSCNPNQKDPSARGYAPNCTEEHNNIETGGSLQPTNTSKWLHQKAGDLSTLIRPIYESQPDVMLAAIHFINSGAGSTLWFPGHTVVGGSYVSKGCEWLNQTNPHTGEPFLTDEEIARCHSQGENVSTRQYNPLERAWFRDCIENHGEFRWKGPFAAFDSGVKLMTICRAVFDRMTGHLIGGATVGLSLADLTDTLRTSRLHGNSSQIAIVRYDDDTVFVDTDEFARDEEIKVFDTDFITPDDYTYLRESFDEQVQAYTLDEDGDAFKGRIVLACDSGIYSVFPLPLPPREYDPNFKPDFLLVHYISNDVFSSVEDMNNKINQDFTRIVIGSCLLGLLGIVSAFAALILTSRRLTEPLLWIERVARGIISNRDAQAIVMELENENVSMQKCSPKTEITLLVSEFKSLVTGFSGTGASSVAHSPPVEFPNKMTWRSDFQQLYTVTVKRKKSFRLGTKADEDSLTHPSSGNLNRAPRLEFPKRVLNELSNTCVVPAPPKKNLGGLVLRDANGLHRKNLLDHEPPGQKIVPYRSSLFWWIVILITIPSILTSVLIGFLVTVRISDIVPDWVHVVEDSSLDLERSALQLTTFLKASVAETMVQEVVRDLHFATRVAGWLLFGGIQRSDAFVDMTEASEECKMFPPNNSCPYFSSDRAPCACEWEDAQVPASQCTVFDNETHTRALQKMFWSMQARDADNSTGNRMSADSFPEYDNRANNTLWRNSTDELPGFSRGWNASGFETAYDRIRVSGAMAVVAIPLYNYGKHLRRAKQDIGHFLAFEADGAFLGYAGCVYSEAVLSHWSSTEENNAERLRPELCPLGKYGYDPRCREWYATGKLDYLSKGSSLHFTAPYKYVSTIAQVATSATAPIAHPGTGDYVGQVTQDFAPTTIREALVDLADSKTSFLIIPGYDFNGGDTVIGPNSSAGEWESSSLLDLLFSNETSDAKDKEAFREILDDMKLGGADVTEYRRSSGSESEKLFSLAYRPVYARSYQALQPNDFSRGVNGSQTLVYIVGISSADDGLRRPFREVEDEVFEELEYLSTLYASLVAVVAALFTLYMCLITVSITTPLITLLRVVRTINAGNIEDDLPPLKGGSRAVLQAYNSFAKLIKVVRMSNIAFFLGALHRANEFISDALVLFRTVDDQKAIGIACNNLGNTLYAMAKEEEYKVDQSSKRDTAALYETGMAHFNESIEIGQRHFETATDENVKADFALQLADRLFNRSLFGLLTTRIGCAPSDAKSSALKDLIRVRELDYDLRDFWIERKLLLKNSDRCYDRLLRRIHGLIDFYEADVLDIWDPKDLIEDADRLLFAAWNESDAGLFQRFTPVGRLQQLEDAAMRLDRLQNKKADAARLAMRMFVEDEFVLESSFVSAAISLVEFLQDPSSDWSSKTKLSCKQDLRKMLHYCKHGSIDLGKNVLFALEINERFEGDPILEKIHDNCFSLYEGFCSSDDHVGVVAYTVDGDLNVELSKKDESENEARQRSGLELATTTTGDCCSPTTPYATQMVIDSPAASNDTYIILIADGDSWDPASFTSARVQMERLNRERGSTIHLLILGLDIEDLEAAEQYKAMCSSLSKHSFYVDISLENVDAAFTTVGRIISGRSQSASRFQCLTMEKF